MTPETSSWLLMLSGALLVLSGTGLVAWGLLHDPGRGRRRCPTCRFDMTAVVGRTCSSCGRTARGERSLYRARFDWRAMLSDVGSAVAGALFLLAELAPLGWLWRRVPDVLVSPVFAASVLVVVAGLGLAGWACFDDKARWRRRCPHCWYDMSGATGLVCPECGRDAR